MSQFMFVVFLPCEDKKSGSGSRSRSSSVSGKTSRPGSFSLPSGNDIEPDASEIPTNSEKGGTFGGSVKSLPILGREPSVPLNKSALSLSPEKLTKDGPTDPQTGNEQASSKEREIGKKEDTRDEEESGEQETPVVEWDFGEPSKTDETSKEEELETLYAEWDFGEPSKADTKTSKDGDANTEGESSKVSDIVSSDNIELQEIAEKTPPKKSSANGQVKGKFTVQSLEGQNPVENRVLAEIMQGQDGEEKSDCSEGSSRSEETVLPDNPNKPAPSSADGQVKGKFTVQSLEGKNTVEDKVLAEMTQDGGDKKGRRSEETNDVANPDKAGQSGRITGEVPGERDSVDDTAGQSLDQDLEETSDQTEGDRSANAGSIDETDKPRDKSAKSSLTFPSAVQMLLKDEKEKEEEEEGDLVNFLGTDDMTLVEKFEIALRDSGITRVTWLKTKDEKYHQVSFETSGADVEPMLHRLRYIGVGEGSTSISVYPATLHYEGSGSEESDYDSDVDSEEEEKKIEEVAAKLNYKTSEFKKSIKARLVVDQVVENIRVNAEFTFDYLMLIILASMIAGLGLAENSSVVLVASMLISPLMGPILAITFGTVIKNESLRNLGIRSEIYGLLICLASGFLFGLISGAVNLKGAKWGASDSWPTIEMSARGHYRSLWVGVLIALPSGAGVALSVLGGNAGSLVGVAISASLLPPAVNAGMLWAFALLTAVLPLPQLAPQITPYNLTNNETMMPAVTHCLEFVDNDYETGRYSCSMAVESLVMGFISLLLTILNIICIILMGVLVLKVKEVAPRTSHLGATKDFFNRDIKVARDAYSTLKGQSSKELGRKFLEEYKKIVNEDIVTEDDINTLEVRDLIEEVEQSDDVRGLINRVPGKRTAKPISSQMKDIFQEAETSVHTRENYDTVHPTVQASVYHTLSRYGQLSPHSPLSPQMYTPHGAPAFMRRRSSGSNTQLTVGREPHSPHHKRVSIAPGTPTITEGKVEDGVEKRESDHKTHRAHRSHRKTVFFPSQYHPQATYIPPHGYHHGFVPTGLVHRNVRLFDQQPTSPLPTVTITREDGKGKAKERRKASFDVTAVAETSTSKGVSAKKTRFNVQTVKGKSQDSSKNAKDSSKKDKDSSKESLLDKPSSSMC